MLYNAVVGKDDWSQKCAIKFQERLQEVSHWSALLTIP